MTQYKAIIIGSGQGGNPLAYAFAAQGWKTALIEQEAVGGSCINRGCTPTKTMVASARVAYLARRAADYGVNTGPVSVDLAKVIQRKAAIVDLFRSGSQRSMEKNEHIDLIFGQAHFVDPKRVAVVAKDGSTTTMSGEWIIIDIGTRPIQPPIPGIDEVNVLDSTAIMELTTLPQHLVVVGGGYIGMEFAQMFRRFGSEVTIITRGPRVLSREDHDVSEALMHIVEEDGIRLIKEAQVTALEKLSAEQFKATLTNGQTVSGSHLLMAVGRQPSTDLLQLEAAGVATDKRGFVQTNDHLETNVPGIYAIGDVKGGPAFTHISYDDFRILRTNLIEGGSASIDGRQVPYTVFTDPQLGRVGLTVEQAKKQGYNACVAKMPMTHVARALEMDEARGFIKVVVDRKTDQILGCAILGIEGGELMAIVQVAMIGQLPYQALQNAIFAHPTLAEALNNLFKHLKQEH